MLRHVVSAAFMILFTLSSASAEINLFMPALKARDNTGATVDVPILIRDDGLGAALLTVDVSFDSAILSVQSVTLDSTVMGAGKSLSQSQPQAGTLRLDITGANTTVIPAGTLATVTFTVQSGVARLTNTDLNFSTVTATGTASQAVSASFQNGSLLLRELRGDVNRNGSVNTIDLQLVINGILGTGANPPAEADVNGDAFINTIDLQLVINSILGVVNINQISPTQALVGAPISITGDSFGAMTTANDISFNGTVAQPFFANSENLLVFVPNGATTGPVTVTFSGNTSAGVNFTVQATPPPNAPSGLSATPLTTSQMGLAWTDNSSNETGFQIERALSGGTFSVVTTTAADVTSFVDTGLTPATAYDYRVFAVNASGNSAVSNTATATTLSPATINSISPEGGPAREETLVVIDGANFSEPLTVTFGGNQAISTQFISSTQISAVAPAASPGSQGTAVDVVVNGATLSQGFRYQGVSDGPASLRTIPGFNNVGLPVNTSVAFYFDDTVDPATVSAPNNGATGTAFLLSNVGQPIAGSRRFSEDGRWIVLDPGTNWPIVSTTDRHQAVLVSGGGGVKGAYGNPIRGTNTTISGGSTPALLAQFATTQPVDTTVPTVTSSSVSQAATNVSRNQPITVVFSELIDPSSVRQIVSPSVTFTNLSGGVAPVARVAVPADCQSIVITPLDPLEAATTYQLTISGGSSGLADLAGNNLANDFQIVFTTSSQTGFALSSVSPGQGGLEGGNFVVINGNDLTPNSVVMFGGNTSKSVELLNPGQMLVEVPPAIAAQNVLVEVHDATGAIRTLVNAYRYVEDVSVQDNNPRPEVFFEYPPTNDNGTATIPANSATIVVFSEEIDQAPTSLSYGFSNSVVLAESSMQGTFVVAGSLEVVSANQNRIVVIRPTVDFTDPVSLILYGFNDSSGEGISDLGGARLLSGHTESAFELVAPDLGFGFSWAVGARDTTIPQLVRQSHASGQTAGQNDVFEFEFNEVIDPISVTDNFTLSDNSGVVSGTFDFALDTMRGFTFTPDRSINGTVTINLATVTDLSGNASGIVPILVSVGADSTPPTIDFLTINEIPGHLNGSAANGGQSPTNQGLLQVPPTGFTIDLEYTESGGAGILKSGISLTSSTQVGTVSANTNLIPQIADANVAIQEGSIHILIPEDLNFSTTQVSTLTVTLTDRSNNASTSAQFRLQAFPVVGDALALDAGADIWGLVVERDFDTHSFNFSGYSITAPGVNGNQVIPDGEADFHAELRAFGVASTTGATATVNGSSLTINEAARNWLVNRIVFHVRRFYGQITEFEDGQTNPGFAALFDFTASQGAGPVNIRIHAFNSDPGPGINRMAFGGFVDSQALGVADFDPVNRIRSHDNGATSANADLGVFVGELLRSEYTGTPSNPLQTFRAVFDPLSPFDAGGGQIGVPVGTHAEDAVVFSPTSDPAFFSTPQFDRYTSVLNVLDKLALSIASTTSHEIGHSLGLILDGAPQTGLYGQAAAFPGSTSAHLELTDRFPGRSQNLMAPSASLATSFATQTRFNRLAYEYLRNRIIVGQ